MKTNLLFAFFVLLTTTTIFAQNTDYNIRLYNQTFLPENNLAQFDGNQTNAKGPTFLLLQFFDIPSLQERKKLETLGITLGDYIPNYAYVARIEKALNAQDLTPLGIRAIVNLDDRFKLSPELFEKRYPTEALNGEYLKLIVTYYPSLNRATVVEQLKTQGRILSNKEEGPSVYIEWPISKLDELVQLSLVQYIEPLIPEVDEVTYWLSNERTNWLNSNINGLNYNGNGFTIAVKEGGEVDATELVEFKGRFTEFVSTGSASGHKTGVARRMASAGNKIPQNRSIAYGADLISQSNNNNYVDNYANINLRSVNHSYGFGVGTGGWSAGTTWDGQIRDGIGPVHTWSAGNNGGATSTYGPYAGIISGYANITGGSKQAKNTFTVGAVTRNGNKAGFSSSGPAYDGRVKPDLMAEGGGGTSHAAPKISGIIAQLFEAYTATNGSEPSIPLLKTILLNTCDDLENDGPDYRTGYGRTNVRRAYNTIIEDRYMEGSLNNGESNTHQIQVPANVKQMKVLIHWADYPAATSLPAIALVNNLDMSVTDPNNTTTLPWILDPTANIVNLALPATPGVDNLNNIEQVTVTNPITGTHTVTVNGTLIPQGPQTYYLTYEFLYNELTLTYPIGGEHFVPGTTEYLYWDSYCGTGTFDLQYSTDNGNSWMNITTGIAADQRQYEWTIPSHTSGEVLVRVIREGMTSTSIEPLNIMKVPTNLQSIWSCNQSVLLTWDELPEATAYRVTRLGVKYMEEVAITTDPFYTVSGVSTTASEWFSVQAIGEDNAVSRRAEAIEVLPGDQNCINTDLSILGIKSETYIADCLIPNGFTVTASVKNWGTQDVSNFDISYQANGGSVVTETYNGTLVPGQSILYVFNTLFNPTGGLDAITITAIATGDGNSINDAYTAYIQSYASGTVSLPYTQNFDGFTTCPTSSDCDLNCTMEQNWFNVGNLVNNIGDDMDWRTDANGTPTGGTGPSGDHTSGSGNYLYIESSSANGNGCRNSPAFLHSPCIDLCQYNQATLSFWYNMNGGSIGSLHVDVFSNGAWVENVMTPIMGNQGTQWSEATVDLSTFGGEVIILRFRGITGNGFTSDIAIDDVSITGTTVTASISCPNATTLSLDGNCSVSLPDFTGDATFTSVLNNPSITQTPTAGTTISVVGNQSVSLQLEDACGLTTNCSFQISVVDDTNPILNCPDNKTVNLGQNCQASMPSFTIDTEASDNCQVVSISQAPAFGTPINGPGVTNVTITATDINGNSGNCMRQVTAIDNTPPTASCMPSFDVEINSNETVTVSANDINMGSFDDCATISTAISQSNFSCSDVGTVMVTLTVTDIGGNSSTCNTTLNITDPNSYCCAATNAVCNNTTIQLDGNGVANLLPSDIGGSSMAECGLMSESVNPMSFDCDDLGNSVSVTYEIVDINGASSSCTAMVTIEAGALPDGWNAHNIGNSGAMGNEHHFDPCNSTTGEFTITGGGMNATSSTTDNVAFASQNICGDGTITAKIESVDPNGYGGLMLRETTADGAKQVAIFSNLTFILRHETRYTTNGPKQVNSFFKPSPMWLRLQRQGSWIFAYYSQTGMPNTYQYVHGVFVPMQSCIEYGLASFTYNPNQQTTAVFSNVMISGGAMGNAEVPNIVEESTAKLQQGVSLYPNPTSDIVNLVFEDGLAEDAIISLRNQLGQVIEQRELRAGDFTSEWHVGTLADGLYVFEIRQGVKNIQSLRFVKTQ